LHGDEHFEYLLGYHGYLGGEMFIMKRIGRCEMGLNVDQHVIRAYNKIHVMECEWNGGLVDLKGNGDD
jgi:hypothetical protein